MRVAKLQVRIAMLAAMALAASSCQTAQKPVPLLPARSAPALPSPPPSQVATQQQTQPATPQTATPKQPQVPLENADKTKTQSSSPAPDSDPIGDLVARVEKEYQAGLDAYHAGQPDTAKQDFDNAFNALLGSNFDIRSDDRLQKEARGTVVRDSFTHGTSEQRMRWFKKGFDTGDVKQGDTFSVNYDDL